MGTTDEFMDYRGGIFNDTTGRRAFDHTVSSEQTPKLPAAAHLVLCLVLEQLSGSAWRTACRIGPHVINGVQRGVKVNLFANASLVLIVSVPRWLLPHRSRHQQPGH